MDQLSFCIDDLPRLSGFDTKERRLRFFRYVTGNKSLSSTEDVIFQSDSCVFWTKGTNKTAKITYGVYNTGYKIDAVHRLIYAQTSELIGRREITPVPNSISSGNDTCPCDTNVARSKPKKFKYCCGDVVRHICTRFGHPNSNGVCCNPLHLEIGSMFSNTLDMLDEKRESFIPHSGEKHGRCKYTDAEVLKLWTEWKLNQMKTRWERRTRREIAEAFGFRDTYLKELIAGRCRTDITSIGEKAKKRRVEQRKLNRNIRLVENELYNRAFPDPRAAERLAQLEAQKEVLKAEVELERKSVVSPVENRRCSTCMEILSETSFNWKNKSEGKLKSVCRECQRLENARRKKKTKRADAQRDELVLKPGEKLVECPSSRHIGDRMVPESFLFKGTMIMCKACNRS